MSQSSIVVFGEALVDIFREGFVVGGAPFNVARHLAGFELSPLFISAIGIDNEGDLVLQEAQRFKLSQSGIQTLKNKKTGVVQVHENEKGHKFEIMPNCAYDSIDRSTALNSFKDFYASESNSKFLYHGTLGLRNRRSYQAYLAICKNFNSDSSSNIYMDINWREGHVDKLIVIQCLQTANIIKLSIEELQMVLTWFKCPLEFKDQLPETNNFAKPIQFLLSSLKAHLLLITYGDLGSAAFNRDGVCICAEKAIINKRLVDTVGAGDAFSSVILLGLINKWPIDITVCRANLFAAGVCCIRGAIPDDLGFYQQYTSVWNS
jgi:fructokinase